MNYIVVYPFSFTIYCAVILFSVFLSHLALLYKRKQNIFVIFIIVLLSLFCGFRGQNVGVDTLGYLKIQNQLQNGLFNEVWGEAGFKILVLIISKIIPIENSSIILCSTLTVLFIILRLWELRDTFDFRIAVFIYCSYYYYQSFNIVRQCLAMAIIFWATRYIEKDKPKNFICIIIGCMFIHSTSIMGFVFLMGYLKEYIVKHKVNKFKIFILLLIIAIVGVLAFNSDQLRVNKLFRKYAFSGVASIDIMPIFRLGLYICFELLGKTKEFKYQSKAVEIKNVNSFRVSFTKSIYFFGTIIGIITSWMFPINADRIALHFRQYEMLYYGIKNENKSLKMIKAIIFIVFTLLSLYLTLSSGRYGIMPYAIYDYEIEY